MPPKKDIKHRKHPRPFYPADDGCRCVKRKRNVRAPKLRKGLKEGSIVILLAGRYRGKRVVFLKQLKSGLLLVTGPHKINGVPLRRVNQAYVIPTSTSVNIQKEHVEHVHEDLFKRLKQKKVKSEANYLGKTSEKSEAEKKREHHKRKLQEDVDKHLIEHIKKDKTLTRYLRTRFTLTNKMRPHELVF